MKKLLALSLVASLMLPLSASAGLVNWTSWSDSSTGTSSQNGNNITVTYTGEVFDVSYDPSIFDDVPTSFTNAEVSNTPGSNGTLLMQGGGSQILNKFIFSSAVIDPYINLFSVGQWSVPVEFNFTNATPEILAQGAGHWGGGLLQQSGNIITGYEGNGLLKFTGTFTEISFYTPLYEYYYGGTVGLADKVNVPEPTTLSLMLIAAAAFFARRRRIRA
jgi:hypothetical protein